MNPRFTNDDRQAVISAFEHTSGVKLEKIGDRSIYLKDQRDRHYCVIGGYGDWLEIPADVLEEEQGCKDSLILLARRSDRGIDIFLGPLSPFSENRGELSPARGGIAYQFNIQVGSGSRLHVRQLPEVTLWMCGEVSFK